MREKFCSKCLKTKPVNCFHRNNSTTDGLQGWCYVCMKKAGDSVKESNRAKWADRDPYAEDG